MKKVFVLAILAFGAAARADDGDGDLLERRLSQIEEAVQEATDSSEKNSEVVRASNLQNMNAIKDLQIQLHDVKKELDEMKARFGAMIQAAARQTADEVRESAEKVREMQARAAEAARESAEQARQSLRRSPLDSLMPAPAAEEERDEKRFDLLIPEEDDLDEEV